MPLSKAQIKQAMLEPEAEDVVVRDFFEYLLEYGEDNLTKLRDEISSQENFDNQKKVVKAKIFHDISIDFLRILNTDVAKGADFIAAEYKDFFAKYNNKVAPKELADLLASPFDNKIASIEEDKMLLARSWRYFADEQATSENEEDNVLNEVITSFEEQSNTLTVLNDNLKKEIKGYKKQIEDLNNTMSTLEVDAESKRVKSADKVLTLREEAETKTQTISNLEQTIRNLEDELSVANTKVFKAEQKATIEIEEMKVENENLKELNADLETKVNHLENKIIHEQDKINVVQKELDIVESMREETQTKYGQSIGELKNNVKKAEEEANIANAKLSKLIADKQSLEKANQILQQDLKVANEDKISLNKKLNELAEKFKKITNDSGDTQKRTEAELNEMKILADDRAQQLANCIADVKALQEDKISSNSQIIKLTEKIKELQNSSSSVESELSAKYRNTEDKLKKTTETLKQALEEKAIFDREKVELNASLKKSMAKIKELQDRSLDSASNEEAKMRDVNFKLNDAKKQLEIMQKEMNFMKDENINLQKNLNLSIEKIKKMQDKGSSSDSMMNVMENEYKAKLKELAQKYYDVKKELDKYKKGN